jgi:hypothetical protein
MRVAGTRVLSGPNLYDDSSGVVIGTELGPLPPAGQPFAVRRDRTDRILGALDIAGLADAWAARAARGRVALPDFLLRLATALVTSASIFPSGGQVIDASGSRLAVFLRCEHETVGITAWDCACKAVMACLGDGEVAAFEGGADGVPQRGAAIRRRQHHRGGGARRPPARPALVPAEGLRPVHPDRPGHPSPPSARRHQRRRRRDLAALLLGFEPLG